MSVTVNPVSTMIPVARPFLGTEEEQGVLEALRSGWITQGPRVAEFERRFAEYVGCDHAIAVSSCTTALQLALWAIGIKPGDEVICPSLSFVATANSIAYNGAQPVFVDIDPSTFNMNPELVEDLIGPRTKAILVVHQIGLPAELDALRAIAGKYGLILIEDAACAIGSEYKGALIGTHPSYIACFSFHPRKVLTTGEGGMITVNDATLAERIRRLRQHSMSLSDVARHNSQKIAIETYDEIGFNYRMTDMQAAVGIAQLGRLECMLERRRFLAERYTHRLKGISWLKTPFIPQNCKPNYQSYMVLLTGDAAKNRDLIMQCLLERNIATRRAIMAIHREIPYRTSDGDSRLPQTSMVTDSGMILPLYHQMTELEQDYILEAIHELSF
jgi:dTDP-4-amino-4,6-dideoxygalactose transaminase